MLVGRRHQARHHGFVAPLCANPAHGGVRSQSVMRPAGSGDAPSLVGVDAILQAAHLAHGA